MNTTATAYPIAANTAPKYLSQPRASGYTACSSIRPNFGPASGLRSNWSIEKEDFANYYGGLRDEDIAGYSRDQRTFRHAFPEFKVKWIRTLRFPWHLRIGGRLSHNDIEPNAADGILSALDPLGADGGAFAQVVGSLRYDTRDNYNNATSGVLEELLVDFGVGGGGDYRGATPPFRPPALPHLGARVGGRQPPARQLDYSVTYPSTRNWTWEAATRSAAWPVLGTGARRG